MKFLDSGRYALASCVAAALLAGCGGSQPPIGAPGVAPQTSAIAAHAGRGTSWMLPEAKREDLLYVSDDLANDVYVLSYPQGKLVGTLTGFFSPLGECVDTVGDVWVSNFSPPAFIEYAHGGTTPIATLSEPGGEPQSCSVDPTSGNLAVVGYSASTIAVYPHAQGTPTLYSDPDFGSYIYCTYDGAGNLFADGQNTNFNLLAELPQGGSTLRDVTLSSRLPAFSMQWDGQDLAIATIPNHAHGPTLIDRVQVSGTAATIIGSISLDSRGNRHETQEVQYWVQGHTIVGPDKIGDRYSFIEFWHYPAGGNPSNVVRDIGRQPWGVTVSLAQAHSRNRQ